MDDVGCPDPALVLIRIPSTRSCWASSAMKSRSWLLSSATGAALAIALEISTCGPADAPGSGSAPAGADVFTIESMAWLYELADRYVQRTAELDPVSATMRGIPGFDDRMTDYSPDGIAAREQHDRETLSLVEAMPPDGNRERIARDVMRER